MGQRFEDEAGQVRELGLLLRAGDGVSFRAVETISLLRSAIPIILFVEYFVKDLVSYKI